VFVAVDIADSVKLLDRDRHLKFVHLAEQYAGSLTLGMSLLSPISTSLGNS
jgi:hypothetical protein